MNRDKSRSTRIKQDQQTLPEIFNIKKIKQEQPRSTKINQDKPLSTKD